MSIQLDTSRERNAIGEGHTVQISVGDHVRAWGFGDDIFQVENIRPDDDLDDEDFSYVTLSPVPNFDSVGFPTDYRYRLYDLTPLSPTESLAYALFDEDRNENH